MPPPRATDPTPHERPPVAQPPHDGAGGARGGEYPAVERRGREDRRRQHREGTDDRRSALWTDPIVAHVPGPAGGEVTVALTDPSVAESPESATPRMADAPPAPARAALGTLLELIADPLYVVDREWRLRFVNRRAAELWRTTAEAVAGRSLWSVLPQSAGSAMHDGLTRAMREQRPVHVESFASRQSGRTEVSAYPVGDGLLVLHRDVAILRGGEEAARALTAERRTREEAERLAGELRAARESADLARRAADEARATAEVAARAKSDFLATMSHELRTPINAVTGYAQLLELGVAGPVTEAQRGYLDRVLTSSRHLLGLVDDVLDLARLESGRMVIERVPGTVGPLTAGALALIASQAAARGVRVVEPAPDTDARFVGDEHRVRQILVNLLTNAVKFTPAGGTVTVDITSDVPTGATGPRAGAGPWVTIEVRDTGVGIPRALHDAVFEPFVQGDGSRTRTVGGTGLGLAVSRGLARLMGGDLTLESEAGRGAHFTLWLPTRLPAPPAREPDDAPRRTHAPRTRSPVRNVPKVRGRDRVAAGTRAHVADSTHGLAIVGTRLRQRLEPLLEGYAARLRADPTLPYASALPRAQLEDHALTFVADLAQTLIALEHSGAMDAHLLRDGSAIQEEIAFRHGEQRYRVGWTEPHLRRDYAVMRDEIETVVRQTAATGPIDVALALSVLHRLLSRALDVSLRGWRHAASR
ncbi:MAG: ATP-binding protein [Gemmatirosa sp.]